MPLQISSWSNFPPRKTQPISRIEVFVATLCRRREFSPSSSAPFESPPTIPPAGSKFSLKRPNPLGRKHPESIGKNWESIDNWFVCRFPRPTANGASGNRREDSFLGTDSVRSWCSLLGRTLSLSLKFSAAGWERMEKLNKIKKPILLNAGPYRW